MKRMLYGGILAAALSTGALAQTSTVLDPLLGFCVTGGGNTCTPNSGNNLLVTGPNGPLNVGFNVSPGPAIGDYLLVIIEPTDQLQVAPVGVNVTDGGTTNTTSFSSSATLFSATPWTAASNPSPDSLSTYLGISASPTNGFSTYAGSNTPGGNNIADPTATGYDVYTDDLGQNNLTSQSAGGSGAPQLNIPGGLPMGSYILGFLNEGTAANPDWLATANSEALLIDAPCCNSGGRLPVPEPTSLLILASGLMVLGGVRHLRKRQ